MKRLFSSVFVAIACCMALSAGNKQEENDGNWYIMSGYGYSVMLGEMPGEGYSTVNSFVWQPKSCWGFGLDYGMNYHNPVKFSLDEPINYQRTRRHNNFFVGPSMYWFPVNTAKHRVHVSGSVNYFHTNDLNQYRDFDTRLQEYTSQRTDEVVINSIGLGAGLGYAYKLGEHVELGARFYTSWSQEEFHLMGMLNIGFAF
mgnify:FL=1